MELGKLLITIGAVFIGIGCVVMVAGHLPWLGKLPGDVSIKKWGVQFYFPIVSCLVISVLLTILFNLFKK